MSSSKSKAILSAIALGLISCLFYWQTLSFDFAYDDVLQIRYNPLVSQAPRSVEGYLKVFKQPTPPGNLYRPLTTLSYKLNYAAAELNPAPYHATNLLLYALCCILIYFFVNALLKNSPLSFIVSLFFLVHPLHVEVVANIIGRAEILALSFSLLSALLLCKALKLKGLVSSGMLMLLAALSFLLAALSKESSLPGLLLLPLFALLASKGEGVSLPTRKVLFSFVFLCFAAAISLYLRKAALGPSFMISSDHATVYAENPIFHLPWLERIPAVFSVLGRYIFLLLFPLKLSADYSMMPGDFFALLYSLEGLLYIVLFLCFCVGAWLYRRKVWSYFALWFLLSFSLTCNLLTPIGTIMGERLAFAPSLGFVAFACCLALEVAKEKKLRLAIHPAFVAFLLLGYSAKTFDRIPVWQTNAVLFKATLQDAPQSPKALYNYAVELYRVEGNPDAAEYYLRKAIEINPKHIFSLKLMADLALERREYGRLEYWYRRILESDPKQRDVRDALVKLEAFKTDLAAPK